MKIKLKSSLTNLKLKIDTLITAGERIMYMCTRACVCVYQKVPYFNIKLSGEPTKCSQQSIHIEEMTAW